LDQEITPLLEEFLVNKALVQHGVLNLTNVLKQLKNDEQNFGYPLPAAASKKSLQEFIQSKTI
jgi:hypothetical protein